MKNKPPVQANRWVMPRKPTPKPSRKIRITYILVGITGSGKSILKRIVEQEHPEEFSPRARDKHHRSTILTTTDLCAAIEMAGSAKHRAVIVYLERTDFTLEYHRNVATDALSIERWSQQRKLEKDMAGGILPNWTIIKPGEDSIDILFSCEVFMAIHRRECSERDMPRDSQIEYRGTVGKRL